MQLILRGAALAMMILLSACAPAETSPTPTVTLTSTDTPAPRAAATSIPPTPRAAASPAPTIATTTAVDAIRVREETITFSAYPYDSFWRDAIDPAFNIAFKKFDADAYGAAPRTATPRNLKAVIVENDYLRLTFLPALGGRLWQVLFKPTQQTLFYNNRVLKPTPWGPEKQGGWLAVGGMEWALPVDEHGYEWGVPWSSSISRAPDGATITLHDSDSNDRVRAQVAVTLPAHAAYFIVHPRIENPTRAAVRVQFWINAQIALNEKNVSPRTEFILPTDRVFVHSTGDDFIPNENLPRGADAPALSMNWRSVAGRDLSRYENWSDYLGVFAAAPSADGFASLTTSFVGAYDHANDLGIARVFPRDRVPGVKLFAFGPQFGSRDVFSDDGSDYFELWGGLPRTFFRNDDVTLAAGESREWDEYWIPFVQTGGLSAASRRAVLWLAIDANHRAVIGAAVTERNTRGTLVLDRDGAETGRWNLTLDPERSYRTQMDVPNGGQYRLRFLAADGTRLAETR